MINNKGQIYLLKELGKVMKEPAYLHLPQKISLERLAQDIAEFFDWRMGLTDVTHIKGERIEINLKEALNLSLKIVFSLYSEKVVYLPVHQEHGWNLAIRALEYVGWKNYATHMSYGNNKTKAFSLSHFLAYPVLSPHSGEHNVEQWLKQLDEEQELGDSMELLYEKKIDSEITQSFTQLLKNNDFKALSQKVFKIKNQNSGAHTLHHALKTMMASFSVTDADTINHFNQSHDYDVSDQIHSKEPVGSKNWQKLYQKFSKKSRYENEELLMNPLNVLSAFFYDVEDELSDRMTRHLSFTNEDNFVLPIHQYWRKALLDTDKAKRNGLMKKKLPQLVQNTLNPKFADNIREQWSRGKTKLQEKMPTYSRLFQINDKKNNNSISFDKPLDTLSHNQKYKKEKPNNLRLSLSDFMEDIELNYHSHEKKNQVLDFFNKQQQIRNKWTWENTDCFYGNPLRAAIAHSNYKLALWLAQNTYLVADSVDLRQCIKPIYVDERWFAQVNMPLLCLLFTTMHHQINKKHLNALLARLLNSKEEYHIDALKKDSRGMDSIDILLHNRAITKKDKTAYLKTMIQIQPELKNVVLSKLNVNSDLDEIENKGNHNLFVVPDKTRQWIKAEIEQMIK